MPDQVTVDAFLPPEIAERMENVGVQKANLDFWSMFALAVLAGAFIGLGAEFFTLVTTDNGLSYGLNKLVGGLVFSLGLILVVVAGAELFTGNNLIVMAWVGGKLTLGQVMRNWIIVYCGNLVGSLGMAMLMYLTRQWAFADYHVGATALNIANAKVSLTFTEGVARGILCNVLVCLAVWLCVSGRSVVDKILAILFPITAFVASGFEHSIANMYFIPMGLLLRDTPEVVAAAGKAAGDLVNLNLVGFAENLISVTTGNVFGGGFMVAAIYWFIYRRPKKADSPFGAKQVFELFLGTSPTAVQKPDQVKDNTQQSACKRLPVCMSGAQPIGGTNAEKADLDCGGPQASSGRYSGDPGDRGIHGLHRHRRTASAADDGG